MRSTHFWRLIPGAALILLTTGPSLALTLGRAQGMAVLGRPLDIAVPVVLDSGPNAGDLCPRAEVFYGESRVASRNLELLAVNGNTANLRVRVARPVDEAFVSVQVQVGCVQTLSRQFVFLPEQPLDQAEAAAQPSPVAPIVLPAPVALPAQPAAAVAVANTTAAAPRPLTSTLPPAATAAATPPLPRAESAAKRAAPPPPPAPAPPPAVVERPRLKLDAAEFGSAVNGALKSTDSLQSAAPADSATRAEAAAQWQALTARSDDLLRSAERMGSLETDLKAMHEGMLKNQAMLADLRGRLEQAERARFANGLVYALAALLAVVCALAAVFWLRSRRIAATQGSWWAGQTPAAEPELHEDPREGASSHPPADMPGDSVIVRDAAAPAAAAGAVAQASSAKAQAARPEELAAAVSAYAAAEEPPPVMREVEPAGADASPPASFPDPISDAPAVTGVSLDLEELGDVQQQADFFVSLGEYERAISVLRGSVESHPRFSAFAWLALLDIYQQLGRQDEYDKLREESGRVFGQPLPAAGAVPADAARLEDHPGELARIQAVWASPQAPAMIEELVRRVPGPDGQAALPLEALRDLLMLHGVVDDLESNGSDNPPQASPDWGTAAVVVPSDPAIAQPVDMDLSMEQHPDEDWKKVLGSHEGSAALDVNLDDLEEPPQSGGTTTDANAQGDGNSNLLDFSLDLTEEFKLPHRKD